MMLPLPAGFTSITHNFFRNGNVGLVGWCWSGWDYPPPLLCICTYNLRRCYKSSSRTAPISTATWKTEVFLPENCQFPVSASPFAFE
mmetsp:Transcript_40880/g.49090  ORF Transcript_40880/g.49090 Transcript_40880/m.49090 type:complete len:87 (-) Transcript_40880:407-667(-)